MSIDKRISEFDIIEEFDITTKIPIIQGSPLKNGIITPEDFAESLGIMTDDGLEAHINADNPHNISKNTIGLDKVDNTSDLDKPISTATKTYVDNEIEILEARPLPNPMITLTKVEYNSLSPKDPNTYYFIKEY